MTDGQTEHRYRNRLLTLIAAVLLIGALRAAFAVVMPVAFAAIRRTVRLRVENARSC